MQKIILTRNSYLIFNNNGLETVRAPDRALELKIPVKNAKKDASVRTFYLKKR